MLHVMASIHYSRHRLRVFNSTTISDLSESFTLTDVVLSVLLNQQGGELTDQDSTTTSTTSLTIASVIKEFEGFHKNLVIVIEALSQNAAALVAQHNVVVSLLLPALLNQLSTDNGDVRLGCLRAFIDIITHYITQPDIYDVTLSTTSNNKLTLPNTENDNCRNSTKKINDLIEKLLLPRYPKILDDADPIPMYPSLFYQLVKNHKLIRLSMTYLDLA